MFCPICKKEFTPKSSLAKFCGQPCQKKAYYKIKGDYLRQYGLNYYQQNKEKMIKQAGVYRSILLKTDLSARLKQNLRNRLYYAIKDNYKGGSAVGNLGCSIEELKKHLESKFQSGMTWNNYGDWHIDHIKPLSLFDLSSLEQVKVACNYTNLQPLWAKDNLAKGDQYGA